MKILLLLIVFISCNAYASQPRSYAAKAEFKRANPCPANGLTRGSCKGYIVDHKIALACARTPEERKQLDQASNMQWQTVEDAKAKDKWERKVCAK